MSADKSGRERLRRMLNGGRSDTLRAVFSAKVARESNACATCGKTALYRVYTRAGRNVGACAQHRDALQWSDFAECE